MQLLSNATALGAFSYFVDETAPFEVHVWQTNQPNQECWLQPHQPDGSDWPDQTTATTWTVSQINAVTNAVDVDAEQQTTLDTLVSGLSAQVTQANTDLSTLSTSTDALAPIVARAVQAILDVTQGLASVGVLGHHIDPNKIPKL